MLYRTFVDSGSTMVAFHDLLFSVLSVPAVVKSEKRNTEVTEKGHRGPRKTKKRLKTPGMSALWLVLKLRA